MLGKVTLGTHKQITCTPVKEIETLTLALNPDPDPPQVAAASPAAQRPRTGAWCR